MNQVRQLGAALGGIIERNVFDVSLSRYGGCTYSPWNRARFYHRRNSGRNGASG
jgi:hypothetical protein